MVHQVTNRISQAKELYAALNNSNQGLVKVLKALNESHKTKREAYEHALDTLSTLIPQKVYRLLHLEITL